MKTILIPVIFAFLLLGACRKESFTTSPDAVVTITVDSLKFDTVFTTAGSITQSFKVINENDQKLRITSIELKGGASSAFQINVDGIPGPTVSNLEIEANDSLYVFASVNVDPTTGNIPFIISDSIEINYNGTSKEVQLEAWGQNAHFFRNKKISTDEVWPNDLPYVILGPLEIDAGRTLTIEKGCKIFLHADAPIIVNGSLQINGEKDTANRVYFQGDRLDLPYRDFPAAWPGIYFKGTSVNNILNYAVLKNAYQAIAVEDPASVGPKVRLNECIIDNAYDAGIIAVNSSIEATNCLISNCGRNLFLVKGGDYQFNHCTVATYSNIFILHKEPVLLVSNYISVNNNPVTANLNAIFRNCIFWGENGTVDNEVVVAKAGSNPFNVIFDHGLMKVQTNPSNATLTNVITNQQPLFDSIDVGNKYFNFRLKAGSPAIDNGVFTGLLIDLDGKPRPVGIRSDLGSYEKQ